MTLVGALSVSAQMLCAEPAKCKHGPVPLWHSDVSPLYNGHLFVNSVTVWHMRSSDKQAQALDAAGPSNVSLGPSNVSPTHFVSRCHCMCIPERLWALSPFLPSCMRQHLHFFCSAGACERAGMKLRKMVLEHQGRGL